MQASEGVIYVEASKTVEIVIELIVTEKMRAEHKSRRRAHEHFIGEPVQSHEIGIVELGDITE